MDVKIVHKLPGRIRLHYNKGTLTNKQTTLVKVLLSTQEGIKSININPLTCSILIYYSDISEKQILALFKALNDDYLNDEDMLNSINETKAETSIAANLFMMAAKHFSKALLPVPVRRIITMINTIPRIKQGLKTLLMQKQLISETLDAAAISLSIANGDYKTAGSINFLLNMGETLEDYAKRKSYDNLIVAYFLMFWQNYDNSSKLCEDIYRFSRKIIEHQDDYSIIKNDFEYKATKSYKLPYVDLDVMRIFALNKAGVRTDPKTGEKVATPKGLKQTSINLQWYELLEYSMPPICDKDYQLYWKYPGYKGLTADELNHRIATWDRLILPEYVDDMMHYNRNDCFIVCEIIRLNPDEIKSRYSISKVYNVDVLNASRSKIGDVMFEKYYSEFSGLRPDQWKGQKTERTIMALKKVIFPFIEFKTDNLKQFLEEIKSVKLTKVSKDEFERNVKIGDVVYTMATGGLHSQDRPMEIWSTSSYGISDSNVAPSTGEYPDNNKNKFVIIHWDIERCRNSVNCGNILREQDTKHASNRRVAKGNAGGIVKSLVIGQSAAKHLCYR